MHSRLLRLALNLVILTWASGALAATAWQARSELTATQFQQAVDQLASQGYRPIDVSGYAVGNDVRYAGIWEQTAGPDVQVRIALTPGQFQQLFNQLGAQGYRLVKMSGYVVAGAVNFAAIWEQRGGPDWQARNELTPAQFQQVFNELGALGYRLVDITGYAVGNQEFYGGIWEVSDGRVWRSDGGLTLSQFQQAFDQLTAQGYKLVKISAYALGNDARFAAIWEQRADSVWRARAGLDSTQHRYASDVFTAQGFRPISVSGYAFANAFYYAAAWKLDAAAERPVVVEFYNSALDNYFITSDPNEQFAVSRGAAGPGWAMTGNFFYAGGPSKVCRFYGSLSPGPNSHFYTIDAAECQALKDLQAVTPNTQKRWNFESNDFSSSNPVSGQCGGGLLPVYRAYNDGFARGIDSNHRITSSQASYMAQVGMGWKAEGVVMCAPAN